MRQQMEAELLFHDPDHRDRGIAELVKLGFAIEHLDWTDPCGTPCVWIKARIASELDDHAFFQWMHHLGIGDLIEAGYQYPPNS